MGMGLHKHLASIRCRHDHMVILAHQVGEHQNTSALHDTKLLVDMSLIEP